MDDIFWPETLIREERLARHTKIEEGRARSSIAAKKRAEAAMEAIPCSVEIKLSGIDYYQAEDLCLIGFECCFPNTDTWTTGCVTPQESRFAMRRLSRFLENYV